MSFLSTNQIKKAMDQITNYVVTVRLPRLSEEKINSYKRPRKRNCERKYSNLLFGSSDEEDDVRYRKKNFRKKCSTLSSDTSEEDVGRKIIIRRNVTSNKLYISISSSEDDEIRPSGRYSQKRYHALSVVSSDDDDDEEFNLASTNLTWSSKRKKRKRRKVKDVSKSEKSVPQVDDDGEEDIPLTFRSVDEHDKRVPEVENIKEESVELADQPLPTQSSIAVPVNSLVGKIRIKSSAELGSNIIFVDSTVKSPPRTNFPTVSITFKNILPALKSNNDSTRKVTEASNEDKTKIHFISKLYKKFFTNENQRKIKKVAEILQNLDDNINRKNDRVNQINESNASDAEKLLLRHKAYSEFNRTIEYYHTLLKMQFDVIGKIFCNENFELLFQLFFLGVLKMFIVSASNKRGTLFKRLVNLMSQSLSNIRYKNERVFTLLRSSTLRDDCIGLVQFIEKFSESKLFGMLFLSSSDKNKLMQVDSDNNTSGSVSIVSKTGELNKIRCGSNLLLLQPSGNIPYQHMPHTSTSDGSADDTVQQLRVPPTTLVRSKSPIPNYTVRHGKRTNHPVVSNANNVNMSQNSFVRNPISDNVMSSENDSQSHTVIVSSHQQPPPSSTFNSNSITFASNVISTVSDTRTLNSSQNVSIPLINPVQFLPQIVSSMPNAAMISNRNGFQSSQNPISHVTDANCSNLFSDRNTNNLETFGSANATTWKGLPFVPINIPRVPVYSNVDNTYSSNSNVYEQYTSTSAPPNKSVANTIIPNALPPNKILSNNENIKPNSAQATNFNVKLKSFDSVNSVATNSTSHGNSGLRSLLSDSNAYVLNQNIAPAEFATMSGSNFYNGSNGTILRPSPVTTSSSSLDNNFNLIAENHTAMANYPSLNNYNWGFWDNFNMPPNIGNEWL